MSDVVDPIVERRDGDVALIAGLVRADGDGRPAVHSAVAVGADTALVVMVQSNDSADQNNVQTILESVRSSTR